MQHFAPQLPPDRHAASLRASQYRRKRNNRHGHGDGPSSSSDSDPPPSNAPSRPSSAPVDLAQLRVAGLSPDHGCQIPPSPFPHAPASVSTPHLGPAQIQKELAAPPSRLFAASITPARRRHASSHTEATNLRRTHLNVLSTVMHRCLLEGDYDRAGRAWGMILRTHAPHGSTVDLRNHGRWAIGAEILLRRNPPAAALGSQNPPAALGSPDNPSAAAADHVFTEHGFELAREYYERLIVQHPTRKQAPHAVDQRSFYPAMFSLWIQEVCEKSSRAREQSVEELGNSPSRSMSVDSNHGKNTRNAQSPEDAIQAEELARAMEIAGRLDDLVKSPPFDKQASLLQLRGNVALWISDLIVGNTPATVLDEWDVYPISSDIPAAEQLTKFKNCLRELHVAENFLSRVEENGGPRQYQPLKKLERRLKELQRQITKLETGEDDANVSMEDDTHVSVEDHTMEDDTHINGRRYTRSMDDDTMEDAW
ncbi:hypothetical protein SVAN01_04530 [Stagonosporopsis vannaccii]|nr:hypothetical protein SVAN01_04530 [Stagonosporopsis vannaccii]